MEPIRSHEGAKALLENETSSLKCSTPLKDVNDVDEF